MGSFRVGFSVLARTRLFGVHCPTRTRYPPRWIGFFLKVPFGVLLNFIAVPYYIWDLKRGPNLENYPYIEDLGLRV